MVDEPTHKRSGTTPYTISQAVHALESQKDAAIRISSRDRPVDLLAVVVESSFSGSSCPIKTACLWIRDASLPCNAKALITYREIKAVDRIRESRVSVGDVLRFNRVALAKTAARIEGGASDNSSKVYHFHHPWSNPEAGPEWCRLCRIVSNESEAVVHEEEGVPDSMATDQACLQQLISWYQTSDYFATSRTIPTLSPLPCRQRSILELQSSVGVMSNVVARVTDVQQLNVFRAMKRKRSSKRHSTPPETFAMLTDGRHSMPFLDTSSRYRSILDEALSTGRPVRLSHIVSQRGRNLFSQLHSKRSTDEEVILVPTTHSTATILDANDDHIGLSGPTQHPLTASLSLTQQKQETCQQREEVIASIQDISVNGASMLTDSANVNSDSGSCSVLSMLRKAATDSEGCSVRINLNTHDEKIHNPVKADGRILWTLCGLDASDLASSSSSSSSFDPSFSSHASRILRLLLREEIELRWTLVPEGDDSCSYRVVHVSLPVL